MKADVNINLQGTRKYDLGSFVDEIRLSVLRGDNEASAFLVRRLMDELVEISQYLSAGSPFPPVPLLWDVKRATCVDLHPLLHSTLEALICKEEANALTAVNVLQSRVKELELLHGKSLLREQLELLFKPPTVFV